ncbi:MAG: hypothetical protein KAS85_08455 [Rhodobacteraceae bacterium]|nr:hypothetical protein [Paracoccaceae bacterium]
MINNKSLIPDVKFLRKEFMLAMLILWFSSSVVALYMGWDSVFPAIGSIALSIGLSIFLTHRYTSQEERRLWDNQEEVQQRMIWRYMQMVRSGRQGADPMSLDQLGDRIEDSFESMLSSKRAEAELETYRYEMVYSVLGTLQWGLGGMLVDWIH